MGSDVTPDTTPDPKRLSIPRPETPPTADGSPWPLTWHPRGYWQKKRLGTTYRYERDPAASLKRYQADKDAWGRSEQAPSTMATTWTVADARNLFIGRQAQRFADDEIGDRQFAKYRKEAEEFVALAGTKLRLHRLADRDAEALFRGYRTAALKRGPDAAKTFIQYTRKMLDRAHRKGMMGPPNYGDGFDPPSANVKARAKLERDEDNGERAYSLDELRTIIIGSLEDGPALFACVMLALNGGFGADDSAILRERMVQRDTSMIRAHRSKTLRKRICPLWPESLHAIDMAIAHRPAPAQPELADRIFLSTKGKPITYKRRHMDAKNRLRRTSRNDSVKIAFAALLDRLGLRRKGRGFYTLRAMFRTFAVGAGVDVDLVAVIMGQKFQRPIDEYYLRGDLRAKLFTVTDHVYRQLLDGWSCPWPNPKTPAPAPSDGPSPSVAAKRRKRNALPVWPSQRRRQANR